MNYVSIKTVLAQIALTIDDRYWNETVILEHATRALRTLNIEDKLEQKTATIDIVTHKGNIPSDFKYLTQVMWSPLLSGNCTCDITDTSCSSCSWGWGPLRLTTNPYHNSICNTSSLFNCNYCVNEFSISPSGIITTTIDEGTLLMSYLAYPEDSEGFALIPDDEVIKEAIFHYILYRYWLQKDMMKESGADQRMKFHLQMWGTLSKKALSLNLPDVPKMENLKNIHNRLLPRSNAFGNLFATLGSPENANF